MFGQVCHHAHREAFCPVCSQVASGPAPLGFAKMRYEPTKKAGVAPAREIAKVYRQTLLGGVAVWVQRLDEGLQTHAYSCTLLSNSCHIFVPPIISAGA